MSFEDVPLGSASIAQVHAATLRTGEAVAVKVMRPGIVRKLRVDLTYLLVLGRFFRAFGILTSLKLYNLARELSALTHEELDFRREARDTDLIHRNMEEDEVDHYAPRVYFGLSSRRVITMERIEGVPMTQLLAAVQAGDNARLERWAERGIRPRRTARLLLRSMLEQVMDHRVFNADPHPANLIVKEGGTLAWVDFGMVGWLDEATWEQQFGLLGALANDRVQAAWEALVNSLGALPVRDLSGFELEVKGILRDWIEASKDPQASVQERSTGRLFLRLFDAIRRAGLRLPADLLRVYRTVVGVDMILLRLDRTIDWLPDVREFVREETGRQLVRALRPDLVAVGQAWLRFFSTTFSLVNWLDVKLPEMARSYQREVSQLERVLVVMLRYGRILLALFTLTILVVHIPALRVGALGTLDQYTGPHLLIILPILVVLFVLMSRMLGELESR
jgi:ubiquinone biosynthesis protein